MYIVFILQCQRAQYNFQIVYKEQKQASLIFFASVLFDVHTYTVAISYCRSTWIRHQKNYILVSDRTWQNIIQSIQCDCSNRTSAG